jgi:carboxylesterase type B
MTLNYSQSVYDNVTASTNCSTASNTLQCLRGLPYETLNNVLNSSVVASGVCPIPILNTLFSSSFSDMAPVDIPSYRWRLPSTLQLQAGTFVKVPFLIGANHDEGTAFGPRGINTTAEVAAYLEGYVTDNSSISTLLALYPDIPEIGIPGTFQGRPGADLGKQEPRSSPSLL